MSDEVPPEPGSQPIPEGHVRLWHYTRANPDTIRREGILMKHSKTDTYGEPKQIWAAAGERLPEIGRGQNMVEFHANPVTDLDIGHNWRGPETHAKHAEHLYGNRSHVTMFNDVPPNRVLAVHEPWHSTYRYLMHAKQDPSQLLDFYNDEPTDRAVKLYKEQHGG